MKIGHLEIPVTDPLRSRSFYVEVLGFRHEETQGEKYVWLSMAGTTVLLNPDILPHKRDEKHAPNLVLYVEDLPAAAATLRGRGVALAGKEPCFRFKDPDGNWFQLVDPRLLQG